jgi:hypothetical protein
MGQGEASRVTDGPFGRGQIRRERRGGPNGRSGTISPPHTFLKMRDRSLGDPHAERRERRRASPPSRERADSTRIGQQRAWRSARPGFPPAGHARRRSARAMRRPCGIVDHAREMSRPIQRRIRLSPRDRPDHDTLRLPPSSCACTPSRACTVRPRTKTWRRPRAHRGRSSFLGLRSPRAGDHCMCCPPSSAIICPVMAGQGEDGEQRARDLLRPVPRRSGTEPHCRANCSGVCRGLGSAGPGPDAVDADARRQRQRQRLRQRPEPALETV